MAQYAGVEISSECLSKREFGQMSEGLSAVMTRRKFL